MSKELKNTKSKAGKVKRFFVEQLWLILLFAPLLVITLFVGKHYLSNTDNNSKSTDNNSKSRTVSSDAVQISLAELSAIITKPMNELLLVEVYFDAGDKGRNQTAALDAKVGESFSEVIFISQYSDRLNTQVPAQALPKASNNKKREDS